MGEDKRKIVGYLGISNTMSIVIYDIVDDIDTYVVAGIHPSDKKPRKYKVYYTKDDSYFNFKGRRYKLSEFMRV